MTVGFHLKQSLQNGFFVSGIVHFCPDQDISLLISKHSVNI